jgi:GNAT superfamily N-acetyltransferase
MGRIVGDGGCFLQVVDMAVDPAHQRRGIGGAILARLLDRVHADAPKGAYVSLFADPPGRELYRRHGFSETTPEVGMALVVDRR